MHKHFIFIGIRPGNGQFQNILSKRHTVQSTYSHNKIRATNNHPQKYIVPRKVDEGGRYRNIPIVKIVVAITKLIDPPLVSSYLFLAL